jgi:predicted amidohydrolase YtcJ
MTVDLVLRDVEVDGRQVSVAIAGGRITPITHRRDLQGAVEVDGKGGALLPGLHDHHVHLLAAAAAETSVDLSAVAPGDATRAMALVGTADAELPPDVWMRVVGYHESIAGDLDRHALDRWSPRRPVRVQDRTGARWTLNSAATTALDLQHSAPGGIERDASGVPTGRLHRLDDWLRDVLPIGGQPDLSVIGRRLAAWGITGVTDTTAWTEPGGMRVLADAVAQEALPQRVTVTGGPALAAMPPPGTLLSGPVKLVIDDADYPSLDELVHHIGRAHVAGRPVAIHAVTRTALVLAVAALQAASRRPGDRIEHGAVIPPELLDAMAVLDLTVVTQPGFVRERGDRYLEDVDAEDLPHLYRCRSLLAAGIRVAGSSDLPYTDGNPWTAIRTAVTRHTRTGRLLGEQEAVSADRALDLYLGAADHPGGAPRRVAVGGLADLVLLDRPLRALLDYPAAEAVVATLVGGRIVHHR